MPGKRGFPHAKVEVGCVDTFDFNFVVFVNEVETGAQFLNVPLLKSSNRIMHNIFKTASISGTI